MRCPFCGHHDTQVVETRDSDEGDSTRRRRKCNGCDKRFTTYERAEIELPAIVKRDGRRTDYDRAKLKGSMMIALRKRPVSAEALDSALEAIEARLRQSDFHPSNAGAVHLSGLELQANVELSRPWSGFLNVAYLTNRDATNPTEQTQYSRRSGAVGLSYAPTHDWQISLDYMLASGDGIDQSRYGRKDLTCSRSWTVAAKDVRLSATVSELDRPDVTLFRDFSGANPALAARYDSRWHVYGQVMIGF